MDDLYVGLAPNDKFLEIYMNKSLLMSPIDVIDASLMASLYLPLEKGNLT